MLDLAGVAPTHPLEGESVLPLLDRARAPSEERTVVVSHHRFRGHGVIEYAVIENRRWKLIFRFEPQPADQGATPSRFQLFDVVADPDERVNVLADEPDVVRRLIGALLTYAQRQAPVPAAAVGELDYDPEQLRQLRALGYVE